LSNLSSIESGKLLIVTGKNSSRAKVLLDLLESAKNENHKRFVCFEVGEEPTVEIVDQGLDFAKKNNCWAVISFGGGSVIDAGKAIAAVLANGGEFMDYMEVIGRGKPLSKLSLPFIAIPTTSGTGAEVTKNSVLTSLQHKQKVSVRSSYMLPNIALVDPELTLSVPKEVTANTGLDAFTQVLESFISNKANPITDALCKEGLVRASKSLKRAYVDGSDKAAREDMCVVSLIGGLALANSKLGAVHGFAGPIGGMFKQASHGAVCASLLANVIHYNVKAFQERDSSSAYLKRFDEVAQLITGNPNAKSDEAVLWIKQLCKDLNVPTLSYYGIKKDDINVIVEKSANSSSMQGNPIKLTKEELTEIVEKSL